MLIWQTMFMAVFAAMLVGHVATPKRRQKFDVFLTINVPSVTNQAARTGSTNSNKGPFQILNQATPKYGLNQKLQRNGPVKSFKRPARADNTAIEYYKRISSKVPRKLARTAGSNKITSKVTFQIQYQATPKYGLIKKRQRPLHRQQNGPVESSNRPVRKGFNTRSKSGTRGSNKVRIQKHATPKYGLNKKLQQLLQRQQNRPVKSSNRPVREGFNRILPSKQTMKTKRPETGTRGSNKVRIQKHATPKYGLNKKRQQLFQRQQNRPVKSSNRPVREGFNRILPSKQTMKTKRPETGTAGSKEVMFQIRNQVTPKYGLNKKRQLNVPVELSKGAAREGFHTVNKIHAPTKRTTKKISQYALLYNLIPPIYRRYPKEPNRKFMTLRNENNSTQDEVGSQEENNSTTIGDNISIPEQDDVGNMSQEEIDNITNGDNISISPDDGDVGNMSQEEIDNISNGDNISISPDEGDVGNMSQEEIDNITNIDNISISPDEGDVGNMSQEEIDNITNGDNISISPDEGDVGNMSQEEIDNITNGDNISISPDEGDVGNMSQEEIDNITHGDNITISDEDDVGNMSQNEINNITNGDNITIFPDEDDVMKDDVINTSQKEIDNITHGDNIAISPDEDDVGHTPKEEHDFFGKEDTSFTSPDKDDIRHVSKEENNILQNKDTIFMASDENDDENDENTNGDNIATKGDGNQKDDVFDADDIDSVLHHEENNIEEGGGTTSFAEYCNKIHKSRRSTSKTRAPRYKQPKKVIKKIPSIRPQHLF